MSNLDARFQQIFDLLCAEDFSSGLTLICPLIDGAGKKIYKIKKPGERFKKVLSDNNDFLYWMISGGVMIMAKGADLVFTREGKGNINLGQSIYKLVRNSLLHEAELSDEIKFVNRGEFGPQGNKIIFPVNLIWALAFMLTYLECYKDDCPANYQLNISGSEVPLNEIWGDKDAVMGFFEKEVFKR